MQKVVIKYEHAYPHTLIDNCLWTIPIPITHQGSFIIGLTTIRNKSIKQVCTVNTLGIACNLCTCNLLKKLHG